MRLKQFIFALTAMLSLSFSVFAQNEAKIGTTEYATLKQAVEAAAAGEEIVLLRNVTLQGGYGADPTAGLRIEKALTINGNKKTIDCGSFEHGIRVYITGSSKADVKFENVTIKNNNPYGRCIDMRTGKIALEVKSGAKLIAQGVNSQPLTIGGSSATYRVRVSNATIDAGETGYGIISFVRLTNNIEISSSAKISGLAALYLKEGVTNTTVNMGNGTYTGTNLKSAESGMFGAVVIEGDNNTIVVNHEKSVVKAVAGDDVNQAVQAAFLVAEGATGNKIQITNAKAQVLTQGAQAQWAVVASDATGTALTNNGQAVNFAVECGGYLYMDANKAFSMVIPQEKEATTVKLLSDVTLDNTWTVAAGQDITLDLNGKTINVAYAEGSSPNHIYAIDNKGTLKITGNGTINARGIFNYGAMTLENGTINAIDGNGGYAVRNYAGSLTMNGGTIATTLEDDHQVNNGGSDATTVRVDEGATFTMNGGELNNICDYTFAIDNYGTTTVKGGKATSVHTTVANYGTIYIEGGEFVCNGIEGITAHAVWAAEGTTNISGGTFNGKDNYNGFNVNASEGAVVNITGGTFLPVHSGSLYGNGTIAVSGGKFFDAVPAKYCATGFLPAENADGTYGVQEGLVRIGETRFRTLQAAVDAVKNGETITLIADVAENVTVVQAPDVKFTIDGAEQTMNGTITVDGKSEAYATAGVTIKNVNFDATNITTDACIRLGNNTDATRYTNNVTVEDCTFTGGNKEKAAIKAYKGGDKNLTVTGCAVDNTMHSLIQAANIAGVVVDKCTVESKNGINLNSSSNVEIKNSTIEVSGYAVRAGVDGGTSGKVELANNTLKTNGSEDAVIVIRGTASEQINLAMSQNVVSGTTHISGTTNKTKVSADANYWNGATAPVVAQGNTAVKVNSYYNNENLAPENLVRNQMGSIYAYVYADRIFGDVTTNAAESLVVEIIGTDGTVIGTSTLEKPEHRDGTMKTLTWRINFGADDSGSWAMQWNEGAPSINNIPAKVRVMVDGKAMAEAAIKYTANGDGQSPVVAAKNAADGKFSFVVAEGKFNLDTAAETLNAAIAAGDNVAILAAGTYKVPTGKNLTITGAVEGVKFANIGAHNMGGANVTFNNVTFDYYPNVNYTGLQHSGNLTYNDCTFNGQVFLYGQKETFNKCTFNQNSADAYNVWTYGAKEVKFNECTFNSAGKSVLIYAESASVTNNVTVSNSQFIATQAVDGKAAIEMDASLTAGINLTIDAATTANGFANGNVSGNSLWNNKKGNADDANNDITVVVDGTTVLAPVYEAKIGEKNYRNLQDAINAVKNDETVVLVKDFTGNVTVSQVEGVSFVIDGNNKNFDGTIYVDGNSRQPAAETLTIQNVNFVASTADRYFVEANDASNDNRYSHNVTIKDCNFTAVEGSDAYHNAVAARFRQAFDIKIQGGVFTNMHSVLQAYGCTRVEVSGVKTVNSKSGVSFGTSTGAVLKNVEFAGCTGYGVRADAEVNTTLTVENAKIEAFIPVVVRKATQNYNVVITGDETNITATNNDNIWCAVGASEYEVNGTMPTPAAGKVKVSLNNNLDAEGVYGNFVPVAAIGDVEYDHLQKAIDAATEEANTIKLVADLVIDSETYTIADGKNVTLDLNGKKIAVTDNKTSNYELFYIYGGMTVTGNGTIELTATNDRDWNASSSIFHNRGGVLTIANGTFKHLGGTDMAYVVDNSGNWYGDATTNINGGELSSTYIAIRNRMEQNSHGASGKAILNVTAGTISGTSRAIWAQAASTSETAPATGEINISGGTINGLIDTPRSTGAQSMTTISGGTVAAFKGESGELKVTGEGQITGDITIMTDAGEQLEYMVVNGLYVGKTSAEASGTWGGIDWTLTYEGTLIIAPTAGTPGTDNSGKWSYEVGQWPEAVRYNSKGEGVAVEGWPYDRSKVKTLIIKEGVTSIGSFTAQSFTNLTGEVVIPYTVKYIGQEAFQKSTFNKITFAPVPEGKTGEELCIAQGALKNLIIEEITFPEDRPVHLHAWMFANSNNLKHVTLPATIKSINGTTHVDYNHNPNQTTGGGANTSDILGKCPAVETITFGSQEVRDLYYNPGWTRTDAPIVVNVGLKSYKNFRAGIDAAKDGETVLLLGNVTLDDTWTIPAGMNLTLNLNGKTISQTKECTASYAMINNKGNLNIVGSGKISFTDTSAGDPNFTWGSYTVRNEGNLVVEKATIEHLGAQEFATHCIMALYQYSGSTTINGGKISTPNYRSARLWKGDMTINGGTFDGQVWVQAVDNTAKLTVNGGTFEPNGNDASAVFVTNDKYNVALAVADGTFNGKVGCSDATKLAGVITGGKFTETAKNGTNANLLANGLVFADEVGENGLFSLVDGLKGAGTVEDPYMITSVKELEIFRNKVNSGETKYNAPGVWVALGADIDLANAEWTVGIGDGHNYSFDGNFDGKNHTIKNLNIKPYADESGYLCGGLFGYIYGAVTIKNLVIENATVEYTGEGESHNVGVLAGFAYKCNGAVIENVTVKGNIKVNAPNTYGVGAIVGYTHTNAPVITNCKVLANNDSYIKGHRFVGGIVGYSYTGATIKECTVKNIAITATDRGAAGIAGCALAGEITKCTVENVTLDATANVAYVVGELGGNVVNVAEHTAPQPWIGGSWSTGEAFIATIGNKYYTSIAAAIEAAKETDVITLIADITATESIAIPAAKKVTLDLNGKTITGTDNETKSYGLININPGAELTINDAIGNGAIKLNATNNRGWNAYSSVISNQRGKLTVNGGTIEHLGGTDMAYAIDNLTNTGAQKAETVINGGVIKSTYRAIRQFLNSTSAENILTVNGGTIEGGNKSIWMQNANANANPGALTVAEDAAIMGNVYVSGSGAAEFPVEISVANAALKDGATVLPSNVHESFAIANNNGVWGIISSVASANGVGYASLLEAVNAAKTGETVTLFTDIALDTKTLATQNDGYAAIINVAGKAVTLDLNGKKITVDAAAADLANANGKMLLAVFSADLGGHLTLTDNTDAKNGAVTLNVNDAKVYSMFASESKESDKSNSGKITVNGGNYTTVGNVSNAMFFTDANEVITVNGGNFYCDGASTTASYPWMFNTVGNNERHVTVNGGTFNVDVNHQHRPFEVKVSETLAVKANDNGTWTVVEAEAYITEMLGGTVNEAGEWGHEVGYATIAEAIAAVNELGNKVSIAKDLELTETVVVPADKTVVLDLNGKTVTMNDASGAAAVLLKNNGNLTIMDGTEAKAGKLSFKTTTPSAANAYASNTISNYGTLTIESGNVENLSVGGGACYALDNYAGSTANINGGKLTAEKTAVRIFNWTNGEEAKATINMNGGEIYSKNGYGINVNSGNAPFVALNIAGGTITTDYADYKLAVYVVNKNSAENFTANVTGGTFNGIFALNGVTAQTMKQGAVAVSGGTFEGVTCYEDPAYGFVSGGTFKSAVDAKAVATGFICKDNGDGTFGVIVDPKHGMVAQIIRNDYYAENQYFATINDAVQAAQSGETVTLIADVETSAAKLATVGEENYAVLVAVKEKDITLNLNGKSITVTPTAEELENAEGDMLMSVFGMDTNGKLTLTGNGSVKVNANGANVYSLVAAYGEGSAVVIENGNYEADAVMASGSLIYSHEMITVMGGTFKLGNLASGANGSPWIFNTIGQNYTGVKVVGGTYPTDINHQFWANEVLVPEAYALKNNGDGTWTVVDAVAYTNEKATSRNAKWRHVGYASLEDAIAATGKYNCQDNVVTLNNDITLEPITVANGVKVAIDLNGKTISGTDNGTASYGLITNKGDLTINGTGAITLTATQDRGWSAYSSVISNQVGGKLTVNGGTIEHLGGTSMAWGIDNLTNGKGTYAETVINGGVVKSKYIAIRQFLNGVEAQNILTVNGGTLEGETASLYFQDPSAKANSGTLKVLDGTLAGDVYLDVTAGSTEWPVEVYIAKDALGQNVIHTENVPAEAAALVEYDTFWQVEQKNLAKLTIEDDCAEYINKIEKNVGVLTYERHFDDTEWQTIVLPFDVPVANLTEQFEVAYIYNASYKGKQATIDYVVIEDSEFVLAANYPYLIKAKATGWNNIVVEDAKLMPTKVEILNCSSIFEQFSFIGNYATVVAPSNDGMGYFNLTSGAWSKMETINPFRFYMQIKLRNGGAFEYPADSLAIRMRSVNANGETTGIDGVDAEQAGDFIFDLHGRRVLEPEKGGIYIVNGKKVIF